MATTSHPRVAVVSFQHSLYVAVLLLVSAAAAAAAVAATATVNEHHPLRPTSAHADVDRETPYAAALEEEKRKWGDKSVRVWGKRDYDDVDELLRKVKAELERHGVRYDGSDDDGGKEKRQWGKNSVRVWGKRQSATGADDDDVVKRNWGKNNVRVWGKRNDNNGDDEDELGASRNDDRNKKNWAKNQVRVWGKRTSKDKDDIGSAATADGEEESERARRAASGASASITAPETRPQNQNLLVDDNDLSAVRASIVKRSIESRYKRSWDEDRLQRKRTHYYPPEGPKRSWRTNVIRVWGKRS